MDSNELEQFYIQATSALADGSRRVLKQGDTFAVFDRYGNIEQVGGREQGLYHDGTRFLSVWNLKVEAKLPLLLSSTVRQDNVLLAVDLTNPDLSFKETNRDQVLRDTLHIYRTKFIWQAVCYERLKIWNYGMESAEIQFTLDVGSDFADVFEVRGQKREKRGELLPVVTNADGITLSYTGLDKRARRMRLRCTPHRLEIRGTQIRFQTQVASKQESEFLFTVSCDTGAGEPLQYAYDQALAKASQSVARGTGDGCAFSSSSDQLNDWVNRSAADLRMMITATPEGPYPYAGVPWYSTPFGRDGIITALEYLTVDPFLARGVLSYLSKTQATEVIPEQDAEPGKILHEARHGEMAALGEVPFRRYYGSVDSTPLFVLLAGAYYARTADLEFLASIWPNLERALYWIDHYGDSDGDGFVEYFRRSPNGLAQQGWKDSQDSVFHADGVLAEGPIALCEVQGYVYAGKRGIANVAAALRHSDRAEELMAQAKTLQQRFELAFWCEDLGTYALALDGKKRKCEVRASNPGHCLYSGIASPEHALRVADGLLSDDGFSGWGIRTLFASEVRYNPMSYHNGSVWPHDNALIAGGLTRYGLQTKAASVLTGLLEASEFLELHRLPELLCGFRRRPGKAPTLYPVACSPQAWSSGAVFLALQACLGLSIDAPARRLCFSQTLLPAPLERVRIDNLQVGDASVDLMVRRNPSGVSVDVLRQTGQLEVVTV